MMEASNLNAIRSSLGISLAYRSCHTGVIDNYFFEGHIPAEDIHRLLAEKPDIRGLAVPGMPLGSPGMESDKPQPYKVYAIDHSGQSTVWANH